MPQNLPDRDDNIKVRYIIETTADDLGTLNWDVYYGYGRINVYRALKYLTP